MSSSSSDEFAPNSNAFLAAIVESAEDAIVSKDLKGTILSWNPAAERLFGFTAEEAIGRPITILFPADRLAEEETILQRIARGERVEHYETVRQRKSGEPIEVALTLSPIRDPEGRIVGASKIVRDIREIKRNEERFRVTLASIGDAVISTDIHGAVTFMNPVAERLTGVARADSIGKPLDEVFRIVNEITRHSVESPVAKVIRDGTVVGLANHTLLISRDATERPIDDSAAPIKAPHGDLLGVVLVFRDVTERRQAELAANRLAAIVSGSADAILGKNLDGFVTSWNPGAERVFGYSADEIIGHPISRIIPDDRMEEEASILTRLQRGERVESFETERLRKDGTRIHVSVTASPIHDEYGSVIGASKIARDITAQKSAELALRAAQSKLESYALDLEQRVRERTRQMEEMIAELEAFSYSLSHDLRAPLRAIQGFTELVLTEYCDRIPEAANYLRRVINAAVRMDRLIQDVLAFARISRQDLKIQPVSVDKLVRDIIDERPELHSPRAMVEVHGPLLPVVGHDASLSQCLTNLLDNAVKFIRPGETPRVRVSTEERGPFIRINVRDNGIGIDPEGQQRLFAVFQRLANAQHYQGTGVGLAIVRKAAERMGGRVGVESESGKGSTFWVELPRA